MNVDEIVSALECNHGKFPRAALAQAVKERETITPKLLQVIEDAAEDIRRIDSDAAYILHIYALYLLSQFRETGAYLPIVKLFSTPGDAAMDVTGDVVTEDLGRILASTFNGDAGPLKDLIERKDISEYVRSAGLQALCILWSCGEVSRQEIVDYYRFVLSEVLVGETPHMWSAAIVNSFHFGPRELEGEIERAFDEGLIETFYFSRDDFVDSLRFSNDEALTNFRKSGRYGLIEDTISEMEHWACFRNRQSRTINPANLASRSGKRKVGRNDPCPCGSGLKYKKCCHASS